MKIPPRSADAVADLLQVARDLRDTDGGCPWDLEQTHATLAKHLLEESSELIEVIEKGVSTATEPEFKEELGDVLFQVVIHSQLAAEEQRFTFQDVARYISDKLISRHPHVYGDVTAENSTDVLNNWEAIKAREREKKQSRVSYLDGVPKMLPALQRAERLGEKASRIGFDWNSDGEILDKVYEEVGELKAALGESPARATEELGDLLFAIAQYARRLGIDSEGALRQACNKFDKRFRAIEVEAQPQINAGKKLSSEDWDVLWKKAKASL
jgi:MazG family protein